jgi:putative phosphoesterase
MERIALAWSGGKDSALALYELQKGGRYEVTQLLTTVTREYDRVSMHGVRTALVEQQAASLGIPLMKAFISKQSSDEEYAAVMTAALNELKAGGVNKIAFGDIFLQDVRDYREKNLASVGMTGVFPLWHRNSREITEKFIRLGFKAITSCVDGKVLGERFAGRVINRQFLADLPEGADRAGENGEYHSFVYDGPNFTRKVEFTTGETVQREQRFHYCDLLPWGNRTDTIRVLVLADTHVPTLGQLPSRMRELAREVDWLVHCGDFTSMAVVEELKALNQRFIGVQGNTDSPEVKRLLPEEATFQVLGRRIAVTHPHYGGPPWGLEEELLARFPGAEAILFGHTHDALVKTVNGVLLLNPGQGYPTFVAQATVGVLKVTGASIEGRVSDLGEAELF